MIAAAGLVANYTLPGKAGAQNVRMQADEKVVVIVNLLGGNDGLNTVVPISSSQYDKYRELRNTLAYDQANLLSLSGQPDFALAPQMGEFQNLFNSGRLAIINGVSVPDDAVGLFDHEAGQYEFQTCDIIRNLSAGPSSGWLGRYLDSMPDPGPDEISPGVDLGGGRLLLSGRNRVPVSINSIDNFQLQVSYDPDARKAAYDRLMNIPHTASTVGERNRQMRLLARYQSDIILSATAGYQPTVNYPATYLGGQMKDCAKIIYGNVGARAVAVGIGSFDTHSYQNYGSGSELGIHDTLLKTVSDAVGAFYQDLINLGLSHRVLILTISEFGRRGYENNDLGTDHGFSSVAFALGDDVKGGIYGDYPDLNSLVLDGSLGMSNDFRSVYATVLANYLGVDPQPILDPNDLYPDFQPLDFV